MKKVLIALLMILCLSSAVLTANDMDFLSANLSGGFSMVQNLPSFGGNLKYYYAVDLSPHVYFGFGNNDEFDFLFPENNLSAAAAVSAGPALVIVPNFSSTINMMVGPAIYVEAGKTSSSQKYEIVSIGLTVDAFYTYYPKHSQDFGLTIGATGYLLFNNLAENSATRILTGDIKGYAGFTFRGGNYPSSADNDYLVY